MALLGMTDDVRKLRGAGHRDRGLKARYKLMAQGVIGASLALMLMRRGTAAYGPPLLRGMSAAATVLFVGWAAFVVGAVSNATNVTDGLDGLLAGLTPLAAIVLAGGCWVAGNAQAAAGLGFVHVPGAGEAAVYCAALAGASLGFLCYNRHPARVFMGDTGALAVGGGLAAAALVARQELLLAVAGAVFLAEFGSSLLQIGYFKATGGRRILPVAPLHHVFEMQGRPEPQIVRGFHLCGGLAALLGLNLICL
jgi:phospho-N-acetylmuramoyl-pentapeptide-transferase